MTDKPLTKAELMDALNQVIPPIIKEIKDVKKELAKKPDRDEIYRELAKKPDKDEVRKIVREEIHKELTTETFRLVPE